MTRPRDAGQPHLKTLPCFLCPVCASCLSPPSTTTTTTVRGPHLSNAPRSTCAPALEASNPASPRSPSGRRWGAGLPVVAWPERRGGAILRPAPQELNPEADKREAAAAPFLGCQLKIEPLPSGLPTPDRKGTLLQVMTSCGETRGTQ